MRDKYVTLSENSRKTVVAGNAKNEKKRVRTYKKPLKSVTLFKNVTQNVTHKSAYLSQKVSQTPLKRRFLMPLLCFCVFVTLLHFYITFIQEKIERV